MQIKKILAGGAAAALAVTSLAVASFAEEVWSGSTDVGSSWSSYVIVEDLTPSEGDILTVYFTLNDDADYWQIIAKSQTDGWPPLEAHENTDHTGYNGDVIELSEGETSVSYTLTAQDAQDIADTSLLIAGCNITITSIDISAAESDFSANIETALYVQEQVTYATYASESVSITSEGEYTYSLSDLSIDPSTLTVLYIKDAAVYNETATTSDISEITLEYVSLKINGEEIAIANGAPTALTGEGVFDFCLYNVWGENYIELPSDTITSVELTVKVSAANGEATTEEDDEEDEEEAAEEESAPEESADSVGDTSAATADKGNADTGVEGVAAVAGVAILAAGAIIVAKKRK